MVVEYWKGVFVTTRDVLTRKQIAKGIHAYLEKHPDASYRQIGSILGMAAKTVRDLLLEYPDPALSAALDKMESVIPVLRSAKDPHAWTENPRNEESFKRCIDTFGCIKGDLKALGKRERDFVLDCIVECFVKDRPPSGR
jgi:hypothetical protein